MRPTLLRTAIDNSITQRQRANVPRPVWILGQVVVWAALTTESRVIIRWSHGTVSWTLEHCQLLLGQERLRGDSVFWRLALWLVACLCFQKVLVLSKDSNPFCNDGEFKLRQERFQRFENCQFSSDQTWNNGSPLHMLHLRLTVGRNSLASVTMSRGPRVRQVENRFVLTCWLCD